MYEIKKQLAWSKLKVGIVISVALLTLLLTVSTGMALQDVAAAAVVYERAAALTIK